MRTGGSMTGMQNENRHRQLAEGSREGLPRTLVDVRSAASFLGVSRSLIYAYVERKQIPHYRLMGRSIRFRLAELAEWREQFHVDGGIDDE
jgi:excisionase family DNA binding protein